MRREDCIFGSTRRRIRVLFVRKEDMMKNIEDDGCSVVLFLLCSVLVDCVCQLLRYTRMIIMHHATVCTVRYGEKK